MREGIDGFCTGVLSVQEMESELRFVVDFLKLKNISEVKVTHWFGVNDIQVDQLQAVLVSGIVYASPQRAVQKATLGSSDFAITSTKISLVFILDHEDELKLLYGDSVDTGLFVNRWKALGYNVRSGYMVTAKWWKT